MYKYASRVGTAVIVLATTASVAGAQGIRPVVVSHPSFGIMAGGNFARLNGDDAGDVNARTAFMGGVYGNWPIGTSNFSIQPRVLYSMSGAKINNVDGDGTDMTFEMNYVRVPVMVRYTLPTAGGTRPFFSLGPSLGFQVGCNVSLANGGSSSSATCDDINTQLGGGFEKNTFDLSGDFEFGLAIPAGRTSFSVGGIFSQGFTDVFKDVNARNQTFSLFAGIGF